LTIIRDLNNFTARDTIREEERETYKERKRQKMGKANSFHTEEEFEIKSIMMHN
jgi:hypothetical protein